MSTARVLGYVPNLIPVLGDVPARLPLGWMEVESGGRIGDVTTGAFEGGELGLFQMSPDERRRFNVDDQLLLTDPDYAVAKGIEMIRGYGGDVERAGVPYGSEVYWFLTKFFHGIGSGAARKVVQQYIAEAGGPPQTIEDITSYAVGLGYISGHSVAKWIDNAQRVWNEGGTIALLAKIPNAQVVVPIVGIALLVGAFYYLSKA